MSRDVKVNVYQWTPARCERLSRAFLRGHCCVSATKYLSHLIPKQQPQQQQHKAATPNSVAEAVTFGSATRKHAAAKARAKKSAAAKNSSSSKLSAAAKSSSTKKTAGCPQHQS